MQSVGAFDAKTHFSQLLDRVEKGEEIIVTRHGQKVAIIKPIEKEESEENQRQRAIDAIRKLRKGVTLGKDLAIKDLINEGRR